MALSRPYRPAVRTLPFHGGNTGSNPVRVAKNVIFGDFRVCENSNAVRAKRSETDCDAGAARRVEAKPKSIPLGSPNPNQDLEPYFFHSRGAISTVERSGVTSGANPGGNFYPNIKNPVMPPAANKTIAAAIAIATFASEIFEAGGGAEFQLKESSWLG